MASAVEDAVFQCIDNKESFIVEAGAGSGKTWTLVRALFYIIETQGYNFIKTNKRVACITYTNVAKNEIIDRIKSNGLIVVRTIHDFLWDIIKTFKKELKLELINLVKEKSLKQEEILKNSNPATKKYQEAQQKYYRYNDTIKALDRFNGTICYREYYDRKNGVISHDDVLWLANAIIKNYSKIYKIIEDTYPIVFIDEYQDTNKNVAHSLLNILKPNSNVVFGFFGDYFQQIYAGSIGKIDYSQYNLKYIPKDENYRCSIQVITLLNKLRSDITQSQTGDPKLGRCLCYYANDNTLDTASFINEHVEKDLALGNNPQIKELYLVTKTIAKKNGYFELHDLYDEENKSIENRRPKKKDQLLKNAENRDCPFANFLFDIEELVELYNNNKIQQLLKKITFGISSLEDKTKLNKSLAELNSLTTQGTISDVFSIVMKNGFLLVSDKLSTYFKETKLHDDFYNSLMALPYIQFKNLYYTVKKSSPFSTNHGTKGAEYDNVVCFIDDGDWISSYSFNKYFDGTDKGTARYDKTKNLFYVICSRAKYNLAIVLLSELSNEAINQLKLLFGDENYIEL